MSLPKYAVLQKPRGDKRTYGITPRIPGGFATPENLRKLVEVVYTFYCDTADMGEKLGDYIDRIGIDTFKKGVFERYENIHGGQSHE